jgi:hypothetical protein
MDFDANRAGSDDVVAVEGSEDVMLNFSVVFHRQCSSRSPQSCQPPS